MLRPIRIPIGLTAYRIWQCHDAIIVTAWSYSISDPNVCTVFDYGKTNVLIVTKKESVIHKTNKAPADQIWAHEHLIY